MKIAMSGSTGFIGSYLQKTFANKSWETLPLTRDDFIGDGTTLRDKLLLSDAVINLAGAPIASRWTEKYKKKLYASRVSITDMIVRTMSGLERKPKVLISASAVGVYPNGGPWSELDSARSEDFLGHLARDWEKSALIAQDMGIRTVVFRFGVVLGRGGALAKMLPIFKLGLGGVIGSGKQAFSWIHLADLANAHCMALQDDSFYGAYNLAAPYPTTNKSLTKALAHALRRPAILPAPVFALKLIFGEGSTVLLDGQSVLPKRLLDAGFDFKYKRIEDALADILK